MVVVGTYDRILLNSKKNQLLIHVTTWVNLKSTLSETSWTQNITYCMILITGHSGKGKSIGPKFRSVVVRG